MHTEFQPGSMSEQRRKHQDELTATAIEVLAVLTEASRYVPRAGLVVVEFSVAFDESELFEAIDHERGNHLLEHIKEEFPELRRLKSWTGLKVEEITPALLQGIAHNIERWEFTGECDVCRGLSQR
jgi:hypothetical protein